MLPIALLVANLDDPEVPPELDGLADALGISSPGQLAATLAVIVLTCFVVKGVLALVVLGSTLRLSLSAEATMAARLLHGYLRAPLEFHLHHNSAELQRTIQESTRRVYQEALVGAVSALGDALVVLVVSAILLVLVPVETVVGGVFLGGVVWIYRRLTARRATASSEAMLEETRRSILYVQQALRAIREIQISGREAEFTDDLLAVRERVAARQRTLTLTELLPRYYLELGVVLGAGLVGIVAFARHPADDAVAILALFVVAILRILPCINRVLVADTKARVAMPNLAQITTDLSDLEAEPEVPALDAAPLGDEPVRSIRMAAVELTYHGQPAPALRSVDLSIGCGERVVLVGRTGSGKTTALNLMLGLLTPTAGKVEVNEHDLVTCRRSWQQRLAYVPQDVAILDDTVVANVAFGVPADQVDRDRVIEVLNATQLYEVFVARQGGIDAPVGEGGQRLSGGQRQRLGLARALYDRPAILALDESTSALDAPTEARILEILDGLGRTITIIGIAHREQAIRSVGSRHPVRGWCCHWKRHVRSAGRGASGLP